MSQRVIAVRVEWDGKLPTVVYVPSNMIIDPTYDDPNQAVCDYLSDQHGFLVKSWEVAREDGS